MIARRRWAIAAAALVTVAVVGVATLAGGKAGPPETRPPATSSTPAGFVEFRDEQVGFAVSYPADWMRLKVTDPQVDLLVTPNQRDSFLVRVIRLGFPVGPEEFPGMTSVTNEIVNSGEGVKLLAGPQQLELSGLPGYFYFYTFMDTQSGQRGAHSHYFLFKGDTMIVLVFQALPEDRFEQVAPLFDQIAASFRVLPS